MKTNIHYGYPSRLGEAVVTIVDHTTADQVEVAVRLADGTRETRIVCVGDMMPLLPNVRVDAVGRPPTPIPDDQYDPPGRESNIISLVVSEI